MKPEKQSHKLLSITRSRAKLLEYNVPEKYYFNIPQNPAKLFTLSIGLLGDIAAGINRNEQDTKLFKQIRSNLLFSAHFFDSYFQSKLNEKLDPYLLLLGSAAYYLCDLPGSASVLVKQSINTCYQNKAGGLEELLLWLLEGEYSNIFDTSQMTYKTHVFRILKGIIRYYEIGEGSADIINYSNTLRNVVYGNGTPKQLLLGDVIAAVIKKKMQNSCWHALPQYSGLEISKWKYALQKPAFIKELWPAQHLLGQANVLRGLSAVIQMPTSAGKTKAIELIIRSAFLARRTRLAIILAPFKALCHEVNNNLVKAFQGESIKIDVLSDILQTDFILAELLGHNQILIVTPEKLVYIFRHLPELISQVGLVVFDEGHQFDNGIRGITYELLLTSLRSLLPDNSQKVLVSAVISNAEAIGKWLNGEANVVEGVNLNPTLRSVGFASWLDQLGRIEYVASHDTEQNEFFVPRVIEKFNLGKKGNERTDRFFPEKSDGQAIALYLGLKLVSNGSIAIFCGTKIAAAGVCEKILDVIDRGCPLHLPLKFSNNMEITRLRKLYIDNLGLDANASKCAQYGIFSHHGNTPHGIRLAVEHAMREGHIRFVICTSTLAQGVNLPIRYLIVTNVYQGAERIKVRDFHNLIGRAGRAGMHTEGSVLFADPDVYDNRANRWKGRRWNEVKELLKPNNSEPCISNLLSIFDPIRSDNEECSIGMEALDFVKIYINDPDGILKYADEIAEKYGDKGFSRKQVTKQVAWRISLISAIESFLLSHWDETENGLDETGVLKLAELTLAFFLADEQKRKNIRELFKLIANNIALKITENAKRRIYGSTLYGIYDSKMIEDWMCENEKQMFSIRTEKDALPVVWPLLCRLVKNEVFKSFDNMDILEVISKKWTEGVSYYNLYRIAQEKSVKLNRGTRKTSVKIENIVELCETGLSFEGAQVVSAIIDFIPIVYSGNYEDVRDKLKIFNKMMKYGLPNEPSILVYEYGFADRVISQEIVTVLDRVKSKKQLIASFKNNIDGCRTILKNYPQYYMNILNRIVYKTTE